MSIKKVPDNDESPTMRRWRVIEVTFKDGTHSRHIWGHDVTHDQGRASSPIKEFDKEAMIATTHSGRDYKLVGVPGKAHAGEYVWQNWCRINGVVSEIDVTAEYFDASRIKTG